MENIRKSPPRLFLRFFRWYCHPGMQDYIEGDLMEVYQARLNRLGKRKADIRFIIDVILLFRPGIIKLGHEKKNLSNYDMYKSYFKIGWRNLVNQKMYSFIKIGGFAIGISACVLIGLFIKDELSYDRHISNQENIYRVVGVFNNEGKIEKETWFAPPFAKALKDDYAEIAEVGRLNSVELFGAGNNEFRRADAIENSFETGFAYIDPSLLEIFDLRMLYGNRSQALNTPNSIVLTRSKAEKYFPNEDPVGKLVVLSNNEKFPLTIGGVIEDHPSASHFQFNFLITLKDREFWKGEQTSWHSSNYHTYIVLNDGLDPRTLQEKVKTGIFDKYVLPSLIERGVPNPRDLLKNYHLEFQPLNKIHITADVLDGMPHGDERIVWLFGGIAIFILTIASINFINLSTARSANRAKEVGLRKVVGSYRSNLVSQFLTESIFISMLSFLIGLMVASLLLPYFNNVADKSLTIPWTDWWFAPGVIGASLVVGVLAGLYPSFYLSGFKPIEVLKGRVALGSKTSYARNVLVIFQFTISILLVVGTFVIYRQMEFLLNTKVGFDKDQVLVLQGTNTLDNKILTFKEEIHKLPQVKSASIGDYLPVRGTKRNGNGFWKEGMTTVERPVSGQMWIVDSDYIKTLGMKIIDGRDFQSQFSTDSLGVIINEAMAKKLGLDKPVGEKITNGTVWPVIGVVENFHFENMKQNIEPLAMRLGISPSLVSVKINGNEMQDAIVSISRVWKQFAPHQPIRYTFLDEGYAAMYADVERMRKIFTSFAILAIVVACLGLFALSAFMVEQRGKEISVRLVLGATVNSVFQMLTWNFVKLVIIAFLIAAPLAWHLMNKWLEGYAYRTEIGWDIFAITGFIAIVVALLTISYQSLRAAWTKPINNLRSE